MKNMNEDYTAPSVKPAGDAQDVVRGTVGVGTDLWGEILDFAMEFAPDPIC